MANPSIPLPISVTHARAATRHQRLWTPRRAGIADALEAPAGQRKRHGDAADDEYSSAAVALRRPHDGGERREPARRWHAIARSPDTRSRTWGWSSATSPDRRYDADTERPPSGVAPGARLT